MPKIETLCSDAKRLLVNGIPLRIRENGTRYFLYPLSKEDYKIVSDAITSLKENIANKSYDNSQIIISDFVSKWGFNPFKEGAFMGSTKIKSDEDYEVIKTLFEKTDGKNPVTNETLGSYQCFCHKKFKGISYAPHPTIKSSWDCMLIAYNNPPFAVVLSHKINADGERVWSE
ncbi:MAG: hypothetical protein HDQ88_04770 [Clostridia bacterium]|nr:hypothetical protein [Clostridia bacterium]